MMAHYWFIFNLLSTISPGSFERSCHLVHQFPAVLIHGIVMHQVHNFALYVLLHEAFDGPSLKSLRIPWDLCFAICHVSHSH